MLYCKRIHINHSGPLRNINKFKKFMSLVGIEPTTLAQVHDALPLCYSDMNNYFKCIIGYIDIHTMY